MHGRVIAHIVAFLVQAAAVAVTGSVGAGENETAMVGVQRDKGNELDDSNELVPIVNTNHPTSQHAVVVNPKEHRYNHQPNSANSVSVAVTSPASIKSSGSIASGSPAIATLVSNMAARPSFTSANLSICRVNKTTSV